MIYTEQLVMVLFGSPNQQFCQRT